MSLKQFVLGLVVLIVFASGLIFFKLGQVPHGMTWDEAAIGYNGYAVITTRRDEWLQRLPISFQSFGDYKAPLGIYINGLFTTVLGMKLWVVRFPFALAGVFAVFGIILLSEQLLRRYIDIRQARTWALFSGVIFLTSPWFLHFARVGFESGISLLFLIWGVLSLVWLFSLPAGFSSKPTSRHLKIGLMLSSALLLVAAMYSYHAGKVVVPLVSGCVLLYLRGKEIIRFWKEIVLVSFISFGLLSPLLADIVKGSGAERFHQATLFNKGLGLYDLLATLMSNFWAHLDPRFVMGGFTPTLRHGDGAWGVFLPTVGILFFTGIVVLLYYSFTKRFKTLGTISLITINDLALLSLGCLWFLIGIAPAVLGVDTPHSNRAILAAPGAMLMILVGARWWLAFLQARPLNDRLQGSHHEKQLLTKAVVGMFVLLTALTFIAYQHHYYSVFAKTSAEDFKDGYLEAFEYVLPYEKGEQGKPEVDKILFTSDYGQPYIYALFVRRTNPIWYQGGSLIKYEFNDTITLSDLDRQKTVIVASEADELPIEKADHVIYGSDDQVRFKIYVR